MSIGFARRRWRPAHDSQNENDQRHDENCRDELQGRKRNQADQHSPQPDDILIVGGQTVEHFRQRTGLLSDRDHVGHQLGKETILVAQCLGDVGSLLHFQTNVGQLLPAASVARFARRDFESL